MANCNGWGLGVWGKEFWGQGDQYAPVIVHQSPPCGAKNVNKCMPITIKVASVGCATLDLDCVTISVNSAVVYDGTGLTFGVNQNDGWQGACAANSSLTSEASSIYNEVWVFYISCGCYACGSDVSYTGTFCTTQGKVTTISCRYGTADCSYISRIEEIDRNHIAVWFSTPMLADTKINSALYDVNSYTLISTALGVANSKFARPKAVYVEKSITPRFVILETETLSEGASYQVTASSSIVDKFHQSIEERGRGTLVVRRTRVDDMLAKLPRTFIKRSDVNSPRKVTPYQLAAVLGIENDRLGGDFGEDA